MLLAEWLAVLVEFSGLHAVGIAVAQPLTTANNNPFEFGYDVLNFIPKIEFKTVGGVIRHVQVP